MYWMRTDQRSQRGQGRANRKKSNLRIYQLKNITLSKLLRKGMWPPSWRWYQLWYSFCRRQLKLSKINLISLFSRKMLANWFNRYIVRSKLLTNRLPKNFSNFSDKIHHVRKIRNRVLTILKISSRRCFRICFRP